MEDENIQNDNMQDHSEEAIDVNNDEYLNDQNYRISDDVAPSPGQFNPDMNNPNIPYEMYNNDINELDVDINSQNLEDAQSQEDVNNPDLDNENENENFNNEEQEEFEQDEMNDNDNDNEINEGNEINELNINDEKDMNYIENDNINQENDLKNVNANNNMNEFNDNNIDDEENNPNLENMDMPQNDPMINDINNNNDIDNMNEINNEEDNFNNINDNDNDNDNNNFESSDMHDDLNNNNLNNNNMNNIKYMNYMYNNNLNNNKGNPLLMAQIIKRNQAFDPGYDQEDDEGFNNPEMNDINNMNDMNNINNNMINNNENNVENQQLMEHIEEINGRFFDLEKEFKFLEKENKELKRQLQYEKMKNREMKPNDFLIYDNTLKQGKLFLEDQKKKNAELKKIINDLEEQKKASDYKLIEANQKIKRLENDFNIINNNNQKEENKNNSNDNNNNNDNEIINLKNKIDEYEIANSKLVLDNENLKKKMDSIEKEYKNQIKIFVQYKNSEIKTYHNTISQYKDYFKNHKINPNVNKQINKEGNNIVNKDNNNNNLDYGTIMVEMSNKDNLIKSLNSKLDKYMNEYKDIIGEKQLVQQKCNEMQFANQKLMNENNDLKEKNENLKTELSNLNQKVKMNKIKYKNNEYIYNQNMTQMKDKLAEYKQKVIMLKMKIKELIGDNQPSKLLKQQSNNNYAKNPNFNNFLDIKQIPLTPTQKKKFSGMSHGNIKINKRQEDSSNFGTNEFYYNKMENINNNF